MSLPWALKLAGRTDAEVDEFYAALRAADAVTMKALIDDPTSWTPPAQEDAVTER